MSANFQYGTESVGNLEHGNMQHRLICQIRTILKENGDFQFLQAENVRMGIVCLYRGCVSYASEIK